MVEGMNEDIFAFVALGELLKALNASDLVVEAGSQDESLVVEGLAVV
jgi:hypothetical protein